MESLQTKATKWRLREGQDSQIHRNGMCLANSQTRFPTTVHFRKHKPKGEGKRNKANIPAVLSAFNSSLKYPRPLSPPTTQNLRGHSSGERLGPASYKGEAADNGAGDSLQKNTLQSSLLPAATRVTAPFKGTATSFPTFPIPNTFSPPGSDGKQILKKMPAKHSTVQEREGPVLHRSWQSHPVVEPNICFQVVLEAFPLCLIDFPLNNK